MVLPKIFVLLKNNVYICKKYKTIKVVVNNNKINNFEELLKVVPNDVFNELQRLKTYKDKTPYHPEDNVYEHIKIVVERLIKTGDIDLILSGLFHDLGKLLAAEKNNEKIGKFRSFGHEYIGGKLVNIYGDFIISMGGNIGDIIEIVENHMRIKQINNMRPNKVKLMKQLNTWDKLQIFTRADDMLNEFKL
jgi:hypothetical protein